MQNQLAHDLKIHIKKVGCSWWVRLPGIIPVLCGYPYFTDALARVQIELDPRMAAECSRKEQAMSNSMKG